MARIRNQNSGPARAITASASSAPRRLDASISDKRREDEQHAEQHLEADHRPVLRAPHPDRGGAEHDADGERAAGVRVLAAHVPAREVEPRFATAISAATTAAIVTASGRSPGASGSSCGARRLVALAGARVAARRPRGSGAGRAGLTAALAHGGPPARPAAPRAAASGSSASVIARTTTTRVAPRAVTSATLPASSPPIANHGLSRVRRRVGDVVQPGGGPARLGRRRVHRADGEVVDVGVGVRGVALRRARASSARRSRPPRRPRAPSAGVPSSWPTWTPSAPQAATRSGPVVEHEQRAVRVGGRAELARGGHEPLVAERLVAQLDHVDPAADAPRRGTRAAGRRRRGTAGRRRSARVGSSSSVAPRVVRTAV